MWPLIHSCCSAFLKRSKDFWLLNLRSALSYFSAFRTQWSSAVFSSVSTFQLFGAVLFLCQSIYQWLILMQTISSFSLFRKFTSSSSFFINVFQLLTSLVNTVQLPILPVSLFSFQQAKTTYAKCDINVEVVPRTCTCTWWRCLSNSPFALFDWAAPCGGKKSHLFYFCCCERETWVAHNY